MCGSPTVVAEYKHSTDKIETRLAGGVRFTSRFLRQDIKSRIIENVTSVMLMLFLHGSLTVIYSTPPFISSGLAKYNLPFTCVKIFWLNAALPLHRLPLVFHVTYKIYHKMSS